MPPQYNSSGQVGNTGDRTVQSEKIEESSTPYMIESQQRNDGTKEKTKEKPIGLTGLLHGGRPQRQNFIQRRDMSSNNVISDAPNGNTRLVMKSKSPTRYNNNLSSSN